MNIVSTVSVVGVVVAVSNAADKSCGSTTMIVIFISEGVPNSSGVG